MLTFMATLSSALSCGVLERYSIPEWEVRPPLRPVYVAPELMQWADSTPGLVDETAKIGRRLLIEHLDQLFCDFGCSERPPAGDVRRMIPTGRGIISVHAPGLRVYGWSAPPGHLVAICAALESDTKANKRLNDRKRDNVLAFALAHDLMATIKKGNLYELFPPTS
jgi:hypothetical protein